MQCQKYQYDPINIHEDKFADYILQMGENLTVATIQRRVASLNSIIVYSISLKAPTLQKNPWLF